MKLLLCARMGSFAGIKWLACMHYTVCLVRLLVNGMMDDNTGRRT